MRNLRILDCTLRDGGYINHWKFGRDAIPQMILGLRNAGIDIIECGFLRDLPYDPDQSVYPSVDALKPLIPEDRGNAMYVAMIAIGDIATAKIAVRDPQSIDGIRLTFHKHQLADAVIQGRQLKEKGYEVFMQPVGTITYSDMELLELTQAVNEMEPYGFYIVDTLGSMYSDRLLHMFDLVDRNLKPGIRLGFHAHNNLQLAFSNAQALAGLHTERETIIDSSVFGMGRGAGNLCTELITRYLNANFGAHYDQVELMEITDRYLLPIYQATPWGYSMPYYLAASKQCHPNYAEHLINKGTLTIRNIDTILESIPEQERPLFHKELLERLYREFQSRETDDSAALEELRKEFAGKTVLIIGPGGSILTHEPEILAWIAEKKPVAVSVNFVPERIRVDWMFVSNRKRFSTLHTISGEFNCRVIATSNLTDDAGENVTTVSYNRYVAEGPEGDSAACMLMRLLAHLGAASIAYAGLDGFRVTAGSNYFNPSDDTSEQERLDAKNRAIRAQIGAVREMLPVTALTPSRYEEA